MKTINGAKYKKGKNGIYSLWAEGSSSRRNSWITLGQIGNEYPEFLDKIADVLYIPSYNSKSKEYVHSILSWLELWKFVSWKQFDSVFRIIDGWEKYKNSVRNGVQLVHSQGITSLKRGNVAYTYRGEAPNVDKWSDKATDLLHECIFGFPPMFEEEEQDGMERQYDKDGNRWFALPNPNARMEDYMHFGIEFKGLRI